MPFLTWRSVYNHYNRVRENIWNMEQEDDSNYDWDERDRHRERERPQEDCMFRPIPVSELFLILHTPRTIAVVEPARIRPRARPSAPNSPVNHFPTPPLEKSNVLILYAASFHTCSNNHSPLDIPFIKCDRGPTGSGESYTVHGHAWTSRIDSHHDRKNIARPNAC